MADVARPILGADILHYYGLLVDIRRCHLGDRNDDKTFKTFFVIEVANPIFTVTHTYTC